MKEALKEAEKAYNIGEIPIGAVIEKEGKIIGRGYNRVESEKDATMHAEIIAIREASATLGGWRLSGSTMYVTAEPCTMCAGALLASRIDKVVIGTGSPKFGACFSLKNLLQDNNMNHIVQVETGIMEAECKAILKKFFSEMREIEKNNYK